MATIPTQPAAMITSFSYQITYIIACVRSDVDGFLTIIDEATSKNIKLDTMFFTSRSKGRTYKKAISLASEHDSNYYNFFSNKIQTVKTSDETIRQQKSQFLDFVLNVSNTVI